MKRFMALLLTSVLVASMVFAGCGKKKEEEPKNTPSPTQAGEDATPTAPAVVEVSDDPSIKSINLWSFTDEVPKMLTKYKELNKDFTLEIKEQIIPTTEGLYQPALDQAGGSAAPDIYTAEAAFVLKYTQGEGAKFASPYADLGIDVDTLLKEADIAKYTIDMGTNTEGKLVGLGYQATGSAFIYRRSIAKDVWGTEEPADIKEKIGPGFDKFFAAAKDLKAKGYAIVSGEGDLWHPVENSSEKGWIVDGKLYIDPSREAFMDQAKLLVDEGYSNQTKDWTDAWFADMKNTGKKQVFGFSTTLWLKTAVAKKLVKAHMVIGQLVSLQSALCGVVLGFLVTRIQRLKNLLVTSLNGSLLTLLILVFSISGLMAHLTVLAEQRIQFPPVQL